MVERVEIGCRMNEAGSIARLDGAKRSSHFASLGANSVNCGIVPIAMDGFSIAKGTANPTSQGRI